MKRPHWSLDPEARMQGVILLVLALGSAVAALSPQLLQQLPFGCVLRRVTHLRCPFCGMTTDFISMWHGHLPRENPFSLPMAAALYGIYPASLFVARRERLSDPARTRRWQVAALCLLLVMFVANNVAR